MSLKRISLAVAAAALFLAAPPAQATVTVAGIGASDLLHSGGCRKSSPPGQCCHAGSQPLHCH